MNIWIINHYAAPPIMAGGTRHYNFAKQLIQRGHKVLLFASTFNHISHTFYGENSTPGQTDNTFDVPFIWIPTPAYRGNTVARFLNMLSFSMRLLLKKYHPNEKKPDIIIGSSPHLFAAFSGLLLARRYKIPYILEVRDLWPESLVDLGRISTRHPLILLMKLVERYLYKHADKIISLLPAAKDYLVKQGVKLNDILWLPNAIDADTSPSSHLMSSPDFTIMYAGSHGIANDLDTVIHAAKRLQSMQCKRKIRICLIGEGPEKNRLKALSVDIGVTIVEFLDAVPKQQIYSILNQADVFLMLLKDSPVFRWGISPNKLFDYMLMARPIIFGVNTPNNPIAECQAGLSIQPSDPKALADAILKLAEMSKQELFNMGERGKAYVITHHHIRHLTDKLEVMMTDMLNTPNVIQS